MLHPASLLVVLVLAAASLEACCVNPFIHTDTDVAPDAPGSAARETGGTLEESRPAVQLGERGIDAPGSGFDIRLLRVQPGVHLGTEQVCDVVAVGRLEPLELGAQEVPRTAYGPGITHRMSIQCTSTTGESWADLAFDVTRATRASEVQVGTRIRVRLARADGGFFDYPIVDFVAVVGPAPGRPSSEPSRSSGTALPAAFDLRAVQTDPGLVGSSQQCAVSHVGDIDILDAGDARRRNYPAGVQNRMTIRCRHAAGEAWADLVFMPVQARAALDVRRGQTIPVTIVARGGGFYDYPVLQYAGN